MVKQEMENGRKGGQFKGGQIKDGQFRASQNKDGQIKDGQIKEWMQKIQEAKNGSVDLSRDEDLSIALMHLISLEEHFYYTAMKTSGKQYLKMLNDVRNLRTLYMKKIVKEPQGEEWCISKHLLGCSMRLLEVGTKEMAKGNEAEANGFFKSAFDLYSLFFAINLKMVDAEKIAEPFAEESAEHAVEHAVEQIAELQVGEIAAENNSDGKNSSGVLSTFSKIIKKIVDCCKE
ncbi:hypothetical protein HYU13_04795 [Candidatus Woesearchaeota archaeon]|nr:hypothetical protein [Candidatus Woesearchaeota archaeon]